MDAAHHVLRYLRDTYDQAIVYERIDVLAHTLWGWVTNLMVADARTKSLPAPAHVKHRNVMIGRVPFCVRTLRPATCVVGG